MKNNDNMKHIYPLAIILFALVIAGCNQNESATEEVCDNTCLYAFDGDCDDGGPNSDYDLCDCGTDCADCGTRQVSDTDCLDGGPAGNGGNGNGGNEPTVTYGSFTDTRDGTTYQTVTIGSTTWMAENLNYETGESWCYDDDPSYCDTYGRLYDWNTAETACPNGWHLPSHAEWWGLISELGGVLEAGRKMKTATGWDTSPSNYIGDNSSGFSGLPSGYREYGGNYWRAGKTTIWWSSTLAYVQSNTYYDYHTVSLNYNVQEVFIDDPSVGMGQNSTQGAESRFGLPCRCIQD